uniref:THAP-type domain-containing protein n=1 Tax=Schizaphis graminum TaxID=13262 RepID=A0A2S2NMJ0_SCHGA
MDSKLRKYCVRSFKSEKNKKRFICSIHFNKNDYSDPSAKKSRLKPNAVPRKYSEIEETSETTKVISSPKTWSWNTMEQDIFKVDAQIPVNETIHTTPTKSVRRKIEIVELVRR